MNKELVTNQRDQFVEHINQVNCIIQSNQTEAVIVGGIALRAAMNKEVEYKRSNGTTPDIDMVGLGPNPDNIQKTALEIKRYQKSNPSCPPVGIEPIIFSDQPSQRFSLLEMVSGLRTDSHGRYFLTFRSLDQEIDPQTMQLFSRQYGEANITTLSQETIFHRYQIRMGYYKPKDISKIEEFKKHLKETGGDHLDPKLYIPYLEFHEKMNQTHPLVISLTRTYWNFDKAINGKLSGASGPIYDLIRTIRR